MLAVLAPEWQRCLLTPEMPECAECSKLEESHRSCQLLISMSWYFSLRMSCFAPRYSSEGQTTKDLEENYFFLLSPLFSWLKEECVSLSMPAGGGWALSSHQRQRALTKMATGSNLGSRVVPAPPSSVPSRNCDRQSWTHVCILFCHVNVPVHRNIYHSLEAVCCLQFTITCNPFLCCCSLHLERLQILHFFWELASTEVSI